MRSSQTSFPRCRSAFCIFFARIYAQRVCCTIFYAALISYQGGEDTKFFDEEFTSEQPIDSDDDGDAHGMNFQGFTFVDKSQLGR